MQGSRLLATLLRPPGILRPYGNIVLLSHIFGSNPEVEGYYELHMGYYSWKSLLRQKLRGYPHIELPEALLIRARDAFQAARNSLIQCQHSRENILLALGVKDDPAP